ncbi:MAG: hypothetical protein RL196_373 [Actinomycetota bacterium]|jgi:hypothetical protein
MLVRKLAVVAVASALVLSASGCSMTRNVATKEVYAPSDGSQLDAGQVHGRNLLVLSDGKSAYLIGSLLNDGETTAAAQLSVVSGATAAITPFTIDARSKVDFGYGSGTAASAIKLEGALPAVGSNIEVELYLSNPTPEASATVAVQVLDGTIPTYADLMTELFTEATAEATPEATTGN